MASLGELAARLKQAIAQGPAPAKTAAKRAEVFVPLPTIGGPKGHTAMPEVGMRVQWTEGVGKKAVVRTGRVSTVRGGTAQAWVRAIPDGGRKEVLASQHPDDLRSVGVRVLASDAPGLLEKLKSTIARYMPAAFGVAPALGLGGKPAAKKQARSTASSVEPTGGFHVGEAVQRLRGSEVGTVKNFVEPKPGWHRALVSWPGRGEQYVDLDQLRPRAAPPTPRPTTSLGALARLMMPKPEPAEEERHLPPDRRADLEKMRGKEAADYRKASVRATTRHGKAGFLVYGPRKKVVTKTRAGAEAIQEAYRHGDEKTTHLVISLVFAREAEKQGFEEFGFEGMMPELPAAVQAKIDRIPKAKPAVRAESPGLQRLKKEVAAPPTPRPAMSLADLAKRMRPAGVPSMHAPTGPSPVRIPAPGGVRVPPPRPAAPVEETPPPTQRVPVSVYTPRAKPQEAPPSHGVQPSTVGKVGVQHPFADWMQPGARVHDMGDVANPSRYGHITRTWTDDLYNHVDVAWEDGTASSLTTNSFYAGPMSKARVVQAPAPAAPSARKPVVVPPPRPSEAGPIVLAKLNDGTEVLGTPTRPGEAPIARSYTSDNVAGQRAKALGEGWDVIKRGRLRFVRKIGTGPSAAAKPAPVATAPASKRAPIEITAGTQITFRGDHANEASNGTVTGVDNVHFSALLDDGREIVRQPIALLSTPRWLVTAAPHTDGTVPRLFVARAKALELARALAAGSPHVSWETLERGGRFFVRRMPLTHAVAPVVKHTVTPEERAIDEGWESAASSARAEAKPPNAPAADWGKTLAKRIVESIEASPKTTAELAQAFDVPSHRIETMLRGLVEASLRPDAKTRVRFVHDRWLAEPSTTAAEAVSDASGLFEMERLLQKAGFDAPGFTAKKLQAEGMGPFEMEHVLQFPAGTVGSLEYTHGLHSPARSAAAAARTATTDVWTAVHGADGRTAEFGSWHNISEVPDSIRRELTSLGMLTVISSGAAWYCAWRLPGGVFTLAALVREHKPEAFGWLAYEAIPAPGEDPREKSGIAKTRQEAMDDAKEWLRTRGAPIAKPVKAEKPKTFAQVRKMLLAGLREKGWEVKESLKVPHAKSPELYGGQFARLWFKPQAVYYGRGTDIGAAHSLSMDMREYTTVEDLLRDVERVFKAPETSPEEIVAKWEGEERAQEAAREAAASPGRVRVSVSQYLDSVAALVHDKPAKRILETIADDIAGSKDAPADAIFQLRQAPSAGEETSRILRRAAWGLEQGDRGKIGHLRWEATDVALSPEERHAETKAEAERIELEIERLRKKLPTKKVNAVRERVRLAIIAVRDACGTPKPKNGKRHYEQESEFCDQATEELKEALKARRYAISKNQGDLFKGFTKPADIAAAKEVIADIEALSKKLEPVVAPPPSERKPVTHMVYQGVDGKLYGDSDFLRAAGRLPGFEVKHYGFGEFSVITPAGDVQFIRRDDAVNWPGKVGRAHLLSGTPEAMNALRDAMHVDELLAAAGQAAPPPPSVRAHVAPGHPVVDSVASLKRLPIGTKLYVVRSMLGPNEPSGRVLKAVRSADLVFRIDDPKSKNNGDDSYLGLKGTKVEATPNGFRLLNEGEVTVEYVFDEGAASPPPSVRAPGRAMMVHEEGGKLYGDTALLTAVQRAGGQVEDQKNGSFRLWTASGSLLATPDRTVKWPGYMGLAYLITGNAPVIVGFRKELGLDALLGKPELHDERGQILAILKRGPAQLEAIIDEVGGTFKESRQHAARELSKLVDAGAVEVAHDGAGGARYRLPGAPEAVVPPPSLRAPGEKAPATGLTQAQIDKLRGVDEGAGQIIVQVAGKGGKGVVEKKQKVEVLGRDGDLFAHAHISEKGKFGLSHDQTGRSLGTFPTLDDAMAFAMDLNRPEARRLFDVIATGNPNDPSVQAAGKRLQQELDAWAPERLQRYRAVKAGKITREGVEPGEAVEPKPASGTAPSPFDAPTDLQTTAKRRDANLAAMHLAAELEKKPRVLSDEDKKILASYSGWGGLSIKESDAKFPKDFPKPDPQGLIHEYYTPTRVCAEIARITAPHIQGLVGGDGTVHALEPSAGIGRFVRAFMGPEFQLIRWHAVEFSPLSAAMLHALNPDVDLFRGPFEKWVAQNEADYKGRLNLVVSNPPYGARGRAVTEDPNRAYREKDAYKYFLRRGLDLLAHGGLGIYLIPAGFMSSQTKEYQELRTKVLKRHHLSCAYRIPGDIFPGALNKAFDVIFFRARPGELKEIDPADKAIAEGRYFFEYPAHILGKEVEGQGKWKSEVYVVGEFTTLPDLRERPICAACEVIPGTALVPAPAPKKEKLSNKSTSPAKQLEDAEPRLASASSLGYRVDSYLAVVAAQENSEVPSLAWEELHRGLQDWADTNGVPSADVELVKLAKEDTGCQRFLSAFIPKSTKIIPALTGRPVWSPRYTGRSNDAIAKADFLYRQHRHLAPEDLRGMELAPLFAAGWCEDEGLGGAPELVPSDVYYTGQLWPKYDRAVARSKNGDTQALAQANKLIGIIKPEMFDEITGVSPRQGWVPLDLVEGWLSTINYGGEPVKLHREKGLVQLRGVDYDKLEDTSSVQSDVIHVIGWINHDKTLFRPSKSKSEDIDDVRLKIAQEWEQAFRAWCQSDPDRVAVIENAYQRNFQGFKAPTYSSEPIALARWTGAIRPKPHQNAGANRVLANRGGLIAFDVGVGKTYTGLQIVAAARQQGWVKRPVIVVPNSIIWKWANDIKRVMPDYRVGVVGSKRVVIQRGPRKGYLTSDTDSPAERAATWTRFQGGEYDVVLMTYSALSRTKMDEGSLVAYAEATAAIQREVKLRQRNAGKKQGNAEEREAKGKKGAEGKKKGLSEREEAILVEGTAAWVAEMMELPEGWQYDPGITWEDIGIDMLIVDEAQNYKNLYLPEAREGGVPRFMGNAGEGSNRAWQLDFRTAAVRRKTGGAGIVLLSATPAKNSPLEFYNLIQYVDHDAFSSRGITDPEQFIDRYCRIKMMDVVGTNLDVVSKSAVVGFQNLHELRDIVFRYGEFKTAEQVGLKLPEPTVRQVEVNMNSRQESKYVEYVKGIEEAMANPFSSKGAILGFLARMALVAIHPELDEKYDWKTAKNISDPHSPKFDACATNVVAQPTCGHIIFCDNIAAHVWLKMVLVEKGIAADRIATLNAVVAPQAADRQRIAEEFNGNPDEGIPPKYDVVIANQVAYEGVDLQVRTCAIHHIDLPWEPATLQQRNGRGVRQGNTLASISIFYYFSRRSQDGQRFNLIQGKRGWMVELVESQKRDTNNPGAQTALGPEEILLLISRDPEKTRERLAEVKAKREEEARAKIADEASATLRAAVARFMQARTTPDVEKSARLRSEAEQRLEDLAKVDPVAWPWAGWAVAARDHGMLVPTKGASPVYDGLRIAKPNTYDPEVKDYAEFGRPFEGKSIGARRAGAASWTELTMEKLVAENIKPEYLTAAWPHDDDENIARHMKDRILPRLAQGSAAVRVWNEELAWHWASDSFLEREWKRWGSEIIGAMKKVDRHWATNLKVPVVAGGFLFVGITAPFERAVPPTMAGWREFLRMAPESGAAFGVLEEAARFWWGRTLPRSILAAATPETKAKREAAEKAAAAREAERAAAEAREEAERERQAEIRQQEYEREMDVRREREAEAKRTRLAGREREEAAELERNPSAEANVKGNTRDRSVQTQLRNLGGYPEKRAGEWTWNVPLRRIAEARRILGQE